MELRACAACEKNGRGLSAKIFYLFYMIRSDAANFDAKQIVQSKDKSQQIAVWRLLY